MLMRRRMLEELGGFDEGYWLYMEDLDLCYRARQAGWVTWYEPSVTVTHVKGGSAGRRRGMRTNYAFHYGMFRFYRKHYAAAPPRAECHGVRRYRSQARRLVGSQLLQPAGARAEVRPARRTPGTLAATAS